MTEVSDEALLAQPIVILGAPRSGTSLVGRILANHPDLHYVIEPRFTWLYGNDGKSDALTAADADERVRGYIRANLANRVRAGGKSRLLEKTPSNSLRPQFVDAVLPGALYIHVIRDGVGSVLSIAENWQRDAVGVRKGDATSQRGARLPERLQELSWPRRIRYAPEFARRVAPRSLWPVIGRPLWGPRLPGMARMARQLDPIEMAAAQWRACVETATMFGRALGPSRYLEIRLEELSAGTIESVLSFSNLSVDQAVARYFDEVYSADLSRKRSSEDGPDSRRIRRLIAPTVELLGYG